MEVSQIQGLDTHAVIGGGKAQAFEISQSAEFFTVLSDTLYRDKKRAVIREVICNAWDAHIVTNQQDRYVEVSLTETELVIQDFGSGIPHEKIGPIYCRYGASTKVADENQTGGFGLGSKAPFAYSDHFSVTSCHASVRSVYAISRGGAETDGKPDFRRMVNVPTDESGVTVSIPLRSGSDKSDFEKIIRAVAYQGGMKVRLNGQDLEHVDYTEMRKLGFGVICHSSLTEGHIYVLYGTVLYPLSTTDHDLLTMKGKLDGLIYGLSAHTSIVLVAPANSVGVTPSRESLSYTDRTKENLLKLGNRAFNMIRSEMRGAAKKLLIERLNNQEVPNIKWWHMPSFDNDQVSTPSQIDSAKDIATHFVHSRVSANVNNRRKVIALNYSKRFQDLRRKLRRAAYTKTTYYNHQNLVDYFRHESRLHLRLASKLGLASQMYATNFRIGSSSNSGKLSFTRIDHTFSANGSKQPKIFVAFSQRDAIDGIKKYAKNISCTWTWETAIVITLRRGQHAKLGEITALAEKYEIEVVPLSITKPKKVVIDKDEALFVDFAKADSRIARSMASLASPKYFIAMKGRNAEIPSSLYCAKTRVSDKYEKIALVSNAKDRLGVIKAGAVPLLSQMITDLKKVKRDVLVLAYGKYNNLVCPYSYNDDGEAAFIHNVASKNINIAAKFSEIKLKDRIEPWVETMVAVVAAINNRHNNVLLSDKEKEELDGFVSPLREAAEVKFGSQYRMDYAERIRKMTYLKPLRNSHFDVETIEGEKLFFDLIAFLRRRFERANSKSTISDIAETTKEAA